MVDPGHPALSVRRQCELLGLSRSGLYYEPGGEVAEDLFSQGSKAAAEDHEALQAQLYEQIGRLKMELDWVKKQSAVLG